MVSISLKTQKLGFYLEYEKTRREISKRIIENSQLKQCYARNIAVSLPLNQQKKTVQRRDRPTFSNVSDNLSLMYLFKSRNFDSCLSQ